MAKGWARLGWEESRPEGRQGRALGCADQGRAEGRVGLNAGQGSARQG
jgi:hypothetical protein